MISEPIDKAIRCTGSQGRLQNNVECPKQRYGNGATGKELRQSMY